MSQTLSFPQPSRGRNEHWSKQTTTYIYTYMLYMYIHACIVCTIIPNNAFWTPFPPLFPALACMTGYIPVPWKTPHPIMFVASVGLSYFGEPKWRSMLERFSCTKPILLHMLVGGLFLHYSYTQNAKKNGPLNTFGPWFSGSFFPIWVLLSKLCSWPSGSLKGHVRCTQYSAMSWTTSLEGKLRYHTIMIIHICKISILVWLFSWPLAVSQWSERFPYKPMPKTCSLMAIFVKNGRGCNP